MVKRWREMKCQRAARMKQMSVVLAREDRNVDAYFKTQDKRQKHALTKYTWALLPSAVMRTAQKIWE